MKNRAERMINGESTPISFDRSVIIPPRKNYSLFVQTPLGDMEIQYMEYETTMACGKCKKYNKIIMVFPFSKELSDSLHSHTRYADSNGLIDGSGG